MFLPTASTRMPEPLRCLEVCAGAGGQALGLERAGFEHSALVELDDDAVRTLRINRPHWDVQQGDVRDLAADELRQPGPERRLALLAAGAPCPPFSLASQQLGAADERDLFPSVLALAAQRSPAAVLIENVKGILQAKFDSFRAGVIQQLNDIGYHTDWRLLRACDYGVPQLRPRAVLVAMRPQAFAQFEWPLPTTGPEWHFCKGFRRTGPSPDARLRPTVRWAVPSRHPWPLQSAGVSPSP